MKKVIDIEKAILAMFILNKAFKSKFKKYWGVTTVDDVEVFNKYFYYFMNRTGAYTKTDSVQRMLKVLGCAKTINDGLGDYQGIENAWFFINPDKVPNSVLGTVSDSLFASKIEQQYTAYKWYNAIVTISATALLDDIMVLGVDGRRQFDANHAEEWLLANYRTLVNSSVQSNTELQETDEEFTSDVLAKYVLLDKLNEVYDIEIIAVTMQGTPTATGLHSSVSIELRFKRKTLVVDEHSTYIATLQEVFAEQQYSTDKAKILELFAETQNSVYTNDVFYKGYLRTSALDLERSEFSKLVMLSLDTGYAQIKKKRKWYQKLIAVVIFVVVVWITWNPVYAAAASGATGTALATAIAYAATISALILTAISFVASKLGYADLVGFYGKFIRIAGIVATITGIYAAVQNGLLTTLKTKLAEFSTGLSTFSKEMVLKSLTYVGQVTNMVMGNQLKKIDNANNSLNEKIKDQEAQLYDMYDKEFNLPLEALTWQNSPLKVDDAQFEVDYLYEPTKMNICRRSFF